MLTSKLNPLVFILAMLVAFTANVPAQSNSPSAQDKAVVLILGDSVMKAVSILMERELDRSKEFKPVSFTSIGSGLCRLDMLNWHEKIKALTEAEKPAAAVMLIGSNDTQPMQTEKGVFQQGTAGWRDEYARRVGRCMDIMIQGGIKTIIWVALPDMREPRLEEHVLIINRVFAQEAASRPAITLLETQKLFSREPGVFTMYIQGPDGMPLYVRAKDGIHFNREGASRLTAIIISKLKETRK